MKISRSFVNGDFTRNKPLSLFCIFSFFVFFVSCTAIQKETRVVPDASRNEKMTLDLASEISKNSPSPESYFHAMRGLQYEEDRSIASAEGNDRLALREYLSALEHDPSAIFLLKRIAVLHNRLGDQKNALFYAEKARNLYPLNGEILLLLGDIHMTSGDAEKGLQIYQKVLELEPEKGDAYFKIAGIYADQRDLKTAEEMINKGIAVSPPTPVAYYYLGRLGVEMGNLDNGLKYFRKALSIDPLFEPAHMEIAAIFERQKQDQAAINVYQNVINHINPRNHQAITRLIQLLARHRSFDEALDLLNRLSEGDPSNLDLSLQKTLVLVEKKAFSEAIENLLPVVEARPEDIRLHIYLATLYEENNELENAVAAYRSLLDQNPEIYDARIRLGYLYFYRLKNVADALVQGEYAKKIDPQRVESYLFSGLVLHDSERYEDAVDTFLEGIEKKPSLPDLHFHLGATFDKLNRFEEMVQEMEKTILLDAKHANALNYLGYTYADKGIQLDEAIELINRALTLRPNDGYFIDSLGWAYFKKGRVQDAMDLLQKAVLSVPDDPIIHEHLGEIYLKNKHVERAKKAWERSLELNPENNQLIVRFKEAGFGAPSLENSPQKITNGPPVLPSEGLQQ